MASTHTEVGLSVSVSITVVGLKAAVPDYEFEE
jgi:hypothetical protein